MLTFRGGDIVAYERANCLAPQISMLSQIEKYLLIVASAFRRTLRRQALLELLDWG